MLRYAYVGFLVLALFASSGCDRTESRSNSADQAPALTERGGDASSAPAESAAALSPEQIAQQAAKALASQLTERLMTAMADGGPAGAIAVCSQEAPRIARQVGVQHGVTIGRTSFKLRNPKNKPPQWAVPLVEKRVAEVSMVDLPDGGHGVLLPIRLKSICTNCHGSVDQIAEGVRDALKATYPEDRAIGFQKDDLRGWFWVEVRDSNSESSAS